MNGVKVAVGSFALGVALAVLAAIGFMGWRIC